MTSVSGESWLIHINRPFGDTSMGKTNRLGPGPEEKVDVAAGPIVRGVAWRETVTLRGADLYRLNCQGCHGQEGLGAPPEINSVIDPVRAMSAPLIRRRMKDAGLEVSYADAAKMAQQAQTALRQRLHNGGDNMPAFPQLSDTEIRVLVAYLTLLAEVPGASHEQASVTETHARVGELIVKSTCHTCHNAVGADPTPEQLMDGDIPPLSALTARKDQSEFVRKVTAGETVWMGTPPEMHRGRMPAFYYLTDEEAADAYLYLAMYPPDRHNARSPKLAASLMGASSGNGPGASPPPTGTNRQAAGEAGGDEFTKVEMLAILLIAGLVTVALVGGLYFTFREFKRLTRHSAARGTNTASPHREAGLAEVLRAIEPAPSPLLYRGAKQESQ